MYLNRYPYCFETVKLMPKQPSDQVLRKYTFQQEKHAWLESIFQN